MTTVFRLVLVSSVCAVAMASGVAAGAPPLGMQGFTWGEIRYPSSEEPREREDLVLEGAIDQGVDIFSLGENTRLNAFGRLDYKLDSESLDYNNKLKLGAGMKLRHYLSDSVVVDLGARYEWERRLETNRTLNGVTFNLSWFGSWLLRCETCQEGHLLAGRELPGLIWGDVRYPGAHDSVENDDLVAEGAVEQGIDWTRIDGLGTLNTFVGLDYVADTEGLEYYRSVGVGIGVKLKIPVGKVGLVQVGTRYIRDYRWESDVTHDVLMAFVNWSAWWDPRAVRYDIPEKHPVSSATIRPSAHGEPGVSIQPAQRPPVRPAETSPRNDGLQPKGRDLVGPKGAWAVQVASFAKQANAEQLLDRLRDESLPAYRERVEVGGRPLYRVRVGPQVALQSAEDVASLVAAKLAVDPVIVTYP